MDLGGGVIFSTAAARLAASNLSSWWDEINASPKWQDGVFYFLCAAYVLVSYAALVTILFLHSLAVYLPFSALFFMFKLVICRWLAESSLSFLCLNFS